jgi:DUF4097 and DUF4098 domain-containing protein YvlB
MHKAFDVSGPAEIDIRLASGDIDIDPTLDGRIEVELIAHDEESQKLVDEARIELHDHHGRPQLVVEVPNKSRGFSFALVFGRSGISCSIRCPHESLLSVRSKSADVRARGTLGDVNIATTSGDVEAHVVTGGVNVKSASGDVRLRTVGGGVSAQSASGDIQIEVVSGPVSIATASGDVRIGEAHDDVSANTVSGDQDLEIVTQGRLNATSVSGDIAIGVRRGSKVYLDCNTISGDTSSELSVSTEAPAGDGPLVEIRAKTVSGDIRITRANAPATSEDAQEVHA